MTLPIPFSARPIIQIQIIMHVVQCAVCYIEIFDLLLVYDYPPSHFQHFLICGSRKNFFPSLLFFKFSSGPAAFRLIGKSINVWQFGSPFRLS